MPFDVDTDVWKQFETHVLGELVPMLTGARASISIVPEGNQLDVKYAVELGASIMLEKPIIVLARPGTRVPPALRRVADAIVEADITTEEGRRKMAEVVIVTLDRLGVEVPLP
jgi:hypothetical protein